MEQRWTETVEAEKHPENTSRCSARSTRYKVGTHAQPAMKDTIKHCQPFMKPLAVTGAPANRDANIEHIKNWLKFQPHLPHLTDDHLHLFLHSCYDNLEKTKCTIESYFTCKTLCPEIFTNRDPRAEEIQSGMNICALVKMSRKTTDGYTTVLTRLTDLNPSHFEYVINSKVHFMFVDYWLSVDGFSQGFVAVLDAQGMSLGHLVRIAPLSLVRRLLFFVQECMPMRLKAVHIINAVPVVDKIMTMIKPFMKQELADLIHIHTSAQQLRDDILDVLPEEYGGKSGPLSALYSEQRHALETEYADWLVQTEELRSDETKRVGQSTVKDTFFGAEGSFRKLDID